MFVVHAVGMGMRLVYSPFSFLGMACEKSLGGYSSSIGIRPFPSINPIS